MELYIIVLVVSGFGVKLKGWFLTENSDAYQYIINISWYYYVSNIDLIHYALKPQQTLNIYLKQLHIILYYRIILLIL